MIILIRFARSYLSAICPAILANIIKGNTKVALAIKTSRLLYLLKEKKLNVLFSDDYVSLKNNINKAQLINRSDIIIIGSPHSVYKKLTIPKNKYLVDIWSLFGK